MRRLAKRTFVVLVVAAVWEAAYRAGLLNPIIFGSPSLIAKAVQSDGWMFLAAFRTTVVEIGLALLISGSIGVSLGVFLGASANLARIAAPILSALIAIPIVILYPMVIAWIGLGPESKVVFGVVSGIFPIALNTLVGVRSIDPGYARMASAMGASGTQVLLHVMAPLALPAIVGGLRLGTALIIIGVVLSEMLASTDGIGFWISYHRSLFNTGQVYLGIGLALLLAAVANIVLGKLEHHFAPTVQKD
ncbi:MAG: binding-protein-dependent transport system inner rane component [Hyphomicrobiales bacterium]|nr:binding-protein-dependent transport system inner rane component [Hyphomicrobiales bacterium]